MIEAFVSARHAVPSTVALRLVIAGTGPREAALKSLAPEGVTFLGNLDREVELPRLYASADTFVFASQTETLGLVVLEAMASGLPAVAVLAGGVADHLRDGINGIGCVPGDTEAMCRAIVALASDPARHRALAAGARRTAEALSWDQELDRLDQSYRSVCNGALGQAWRAIEPRPPSTRPATGSPSTSFRP